MSDMYLLDLVIAHEYRSTQSEEIEHAGQRKCANPQAWKTR